MAGQPVPQLSSSSSFDLDKNITLGSVPLTLAVSGASDHDVFDAILHNTPFPERPNGKIALANLALKEQTGKQLSLGTAGASVTFGESADFQTGVGIFNSAADAISSLQLEDAPQLNLQISGAADEKFLVMLWGYGFDVTGSVTHPIGVFGSATFGAEAKRDARYAVIHRFKKNTGAATAMGETVKSWRLPRQIEKTADLRPGTWLIAEVDGSLAVSLAAQLGYDFNFIQQAQLLGVTRSLGAKIDAGLKATLGFTVSGRYLLVVGRECADDKADDANILHFQIYKQAKRGLNFGLNFNLIADLKNDVPTADDLVKAIFGVHGAQVVNDLHLIRDWTDPSKDLGQSAARLVNDTGLKLLSKASGIPLNDIKNNFEQARQMVLGAFAKWDALPDQVAATTWKILGQVSGNADFKTFLEGLADPDSDKRAQTLADALETAVFGDDPKGQWLSSLADQGLLALSSELDKVQPVAAQTLDILNGGVIKNIQDFINEKLDLVAIQKAVSQNDFDSLDNWLIKRLGDFFNKDLHFEDLKQVQAAINMAFNKVDEIQSKINQALNNHYSFEVAATYAKNTTSTALLDAAFDLSKAFAASAFKTVVTSNKLDTLLTHSVDGVQIKAATLSHEVERTGTVQINMPFFSFDSSHVNDSLATLTAGSSAGTVTLQLKASDLEMVKNRYRSDLSVLGRLTLNNGTLQMAPDESQSISYELRQAKARMAVSDFEHQVTPLLSNYFPNLLAGSQLQTFYSDLDRTVEGVLHNGTNEFGDVALLLQVSAPATTLSAWFIRRDSARLKRDGMNLSRSIQATLRKIIPFYYLQEDSKLAPNSAIAPLLVWSCMPVSTAIDFDVQQGTIRLNTDSDVFWDWPSVDLRRAVARDSHTTSGLIETLLRLQKRLQDDGDGDAQFFGASSVSTWLDMSLNRDGDLRLTSLLSTEAQIIRGATSALQDLNGMLTNIQQNPAKALERFAEFGAAFTDAFHDNLSSIYGDDSLRALSSMLLIETSRAIAPELAVGNAKTLMSILTLTNGHSFDLESFLSGEMPPRDQVALAQTLVNTTG
jgi:hypothetical protein